MNHFAGRGVIMTRKGILLTLLKSQNHQNDDLFTARLSSERAFFVYLQKISYQSSFNQFLLTMKSRLIPLFLAGAALFGACSKAPMTTTVAWQSLGNESDSVGDYYIQRFAVTGNLDFDRLAFNQFARKMSCLNPEDTLIEIVPGYYCVASPRFKAAAEGDTVFVDIMTRAALHSMRYVPGTVHIVKADGSTAPADYTIGDITADRCLWATAKRDRMPYGDKFYDLNESLVGGAAGVYDVVPSFKKVTLTGGTASAKPVIVSETIDGNGDTYNIIVSGDTARVVAPAKMMKLAMARCRALVEGFTGETVPAAVIEDAPDFEYRGLMIDIARNYQTPAQMKRILDMMARYGLNHLHFHFADDEAWRVDIPGLPELVAVGGRRGYTLDEHDFLAQLFTGDGNPANLGNSSNGYFTAEDFIDMLQYADSLGIKVMPEIESPGHARAAIKAMENRYRRTGDASLRLTEDGDSSVYTSAQSFHDNVMNPALESTYDFMAKVFDGVIELYDRAGVELPAIHIGGDEVPRNAWSGSRAVGELMAAEGLENDKEVHARFIRRVNDYLASKGVKMSGWQEISSGHPAEYNAAVSPNVYSVNSWTQSSDKPDSHSRQALEGGYPLILSNVNHFYLDMAYSWHPHELGLTWGGTVDEFDALAGYPSRLVEVKPGDKSKIFGVSGQLWAETLRDPQTQEALLLPKMLGMAERAWNADSTYSDATFNAVVAAHEIPVWESRGYNYHLRQPGIKLVDGKVMLNGAYPGMGEIRYTLDGINPTDASAVYESPFALPAGVGQIRAVYFLNGKKSVPSILFVD